MIVDIGQYFVNIKVFPVSPVYMDCLLIIHFAFKCRECQHPKITGDEKQKSIFPFEVLGTCSCISVQ